ncbi:MAG: hypothetical protein ACK4TP_15485 [Hyphomicrobium sp.]
MLDKILRARAAKRVGGKSPALAAAAQALEAVESKYQLGLIERVELRNALVQELMELVHSKAPAQSARPQAAPELWSQREGRKENPVAFIRRVYAPWLSRGLVRGDLRSLDPPLYQALAVWMHRHPEEKFAELDSPFEGVSNPTMHSGAAIAAHLAKPRPKRAKLFGARRK